MYFGRKLKHRSWQRLNNRLENKLVTLCTFKELYVGDELRWFKNTQQHSLHCKSKGGSTSGAFGYVTGESDMKSSLPKRPKTTFGRNWVEYNRVSKTTHFDTNFKTIYNWFDFYS